MAKVELRDQANNRSDPIEMINATDVAIAVIEWLELSNEIEAAIKQVGRAGLIDHIETELDEHGLEVRVLEQAVHEVTDQIAEAMGKSAWYGHGSYAVSATDQAGLRVDVEIVEEEQVEQED